MSEVDALIAAARNASLPVEEREASVLALQHHVSARYEAWQVVCELLHDAHQDARIRRAAARAIGVGTPVAAPNQLCRAFSGDPDRVLRAEALAVLTMLGSVPPAVEPRLLRDLAALGGERKLVSLLNLASSYGRDSRALTALLDATRDSDPQIRSAAIHGLSMLGEMLPVAAALADESPEVRRAAAEMLGYYSLRTASDVAALKAASDDPDPAVREAATIALRRLAILPKRQPRARPTPVPLVASVGTLPSHDWQPLLARWSAEWLRIEEYAATLPDEVLQSGWLGFPPASEEALRAAEERLGVTLPPSYREFLLVSDGWRRTSSFIDRLFSAQEIDRFASLNPEWLAVWTREPSGVSEEEHRRYGDPADDITFCTEYLHEAMQISDEGDEAVYLLNPAVAAPDGEWEAWLFASWMPGARRYPSFWALTQAEYASFLQLERPEE